MRRGGRTARRALAAGLALLALSVGAARAQTATSDEIRGVVELFTAQGCASCPPAEHLLSALSEESGILALAYHVDYWDYIGWRDTYGSDSNTARQRAYAKAFRTSMLYTPQAVVNGRHEMVGSRESELRAALAPEPKPGGAAGVLATRLGPSLPPAGLVGIAGGARIVLRRTGDMLRITAEPSAAEAASRSSGAGAGNGDERPVLLLVTFDDRVRVPVSDGENAGKTLVNAHAVRDWRVLGLWRDETMDVTIPLAVLSDQPLGGTGCAAILQAMSEEGVPGPILAAAMLEFPREGGASKP